MASDRGYLEFILAQLADLDGVRARAMMGEYILYYRDRVIGGIYDDRLLVKATPGAQPICRRPRKNCRIPALSLCCWWTM